MGKTPKTFRLADDVVALLAARGPGADSATAAVEDALRLQSEAQKALGVEWYELERRAKVAGIPLGQVLGELALAGLQASAAPKGRKR
jgi:hypothetical protein